MHNRSLLNRVSSPRLLQTNHTPTKLWKKVTSVKSDSEEFWKDVQLLTPADTEKLTREDAKDLQHVVQEVAQMDDDINNAKRQAQVSSEYDTIKAELADVEI